MTQPAASGPDQAGQVTTRATIHNHHGQLVLDGKHTYLLKAARQSTSQATS
jgi:acyl dehydratase